MSAYVRKIRLLGGPRCGQEFQTDKDLRYWACEEKFTKRTHTYRFTTSRATDGAYLYVSEHIRLLGSDDPEMAQ